MLDPLGKITKYWIASVFCKALALIHSTTICVVDSVIHVKKERNDHGKIVVYKNMVEMSERCYC